MLTKEEQDGLRQGNLVLVIMWGAMLLSVVVYLGVAYFGRKEVFVPIDSVIRWGVAIAALTCSLASLAVFPLRMSSGKLRKILKKEERIESLQALYFTTLLVRLALAESVAVFGLILAQMTGNFAEIFPFAGASIVLLLISFPSADALKNRTMGL